ncbi:MAG: helix-turn-helix domain-containing protein [Erysipelotrichales bacterium]|nr:helix-turn-helix domain-containing protein [Erysipelotrichales bacterium]
MRSDKNRQVGKMLGQRIRSLRQARGYSQEELAELAELHRTYIGQIERAEKNITFINLDRIIRALNSNINDFFDSDEWL